MCLKDLKKTLESGEIINLQENSMEGLLITDLFFESRGQVPNQYIKIARNHLKSEEKNIGIRNCIHILN